MKTTILLSTFFFFNVLLHAQVNPNWVTKLEVPYTQMIALENLSANELLALKTKNYSKQHHVITINKKTGDTTEVLKLDGGAGFKVTALKADYLGNVLVAGTYKKEMRIGAYVKKSETHVTKTFLAKFKPGQALDTTKIQHFEALETSQLGILPNNEIVLSGFFRYKADILGQQLEAGLDDVFVMKLTPDFQLGWIKNYGEVSDERTTSMHVSKDGNIIVAAKFSHKFNLGENNRIELTPGNNSGSAIWKMSPSGTIIWYQVFSGYKNGRPEIVKITSDDSYLFLGMSFSGDCLMDGNTLSSMGKEDLSIVRLDQNGKNRQLLMHVKSPYDAEIAGLLSADEKLFLAGNFQKRIHIKDELVYAKGDTSRYSAAKEIFYVRINKQSNQFQLETIGSPDSETCQTIASDKSIFYLAGTYDKSFEWGAFSLNNQDTKPDAYIAALPRVNGLSSTTDTPDENDQGTDDEAEGNDDTGEEGPNEPGCPDPSRPSILSIKESTNSLTVNWRKVDRALHYELLVSTTATMSDIVYRNINIGPAEDPSFRIESLEPNQTYYVRVFVEINCEQKREKSLDVAGKTKPLTGGPSEGESTPENSNNPEEQDAVESNDSVCPTPPPKITKVDAENYAFTAYWKPIPKINNYSIYVSTHRDLEDTIYSANNIAKVEAPFHRVPMLKAKQDYYFNIVATKLCGHLSNSSRSQTMKVTTTCYDDTTIFSNVNDSVTVITITDCTGNLKSIATYERDTLVVIHDSIGPIFIPPNDQTRISYYPEIDPVQCDSNEYKLTLYKHTNGTREVDQAFCVPMYNKDTIPKNSKCYELSTDREKLICLAEEGARKIEKVYDELSTLKEELNSLKKSECENCKTKGDTLIFFERIKWILDRDKELADTAELIRNDYASRMTAIVAEGNVYFDIKNTGAGFTIAPKAQAKFVRWNKYDDVFDYSDDAGTIGGPQLMVDILVSNFPKRPIKKHHHNRFSETIYNVDRKFFDEAGNQTSKTGVFSFNPCYQKLGRIRTNIPLLYDYKKASYLELSNPKYKPFLNHLWNECDPSSLSKKKNIYAISRRILYPYSETIHGNHIARTFAFITLTDINKKLGEMESYFYSKCSAMSPLYFKYFEDEKTRIMFLLNLRANVSKAYNKFYYKDGYKIYQGFKEFDPILGAKIKKAFE